MSNDVMKSEHLVVGLGVFNNEHDILQWPGVRSGTREHFFSEYLTVRTARRNSPNEHRRASKISTAFEATRDLIATLRQIPYSKIADKEVVASFVAHRSDVLRGWNPELLAVVREVAADHRLDSCRYELSDVQVSRYWVELLVRDKAEPASFLSGIKIPKDHICADDIGNAVNLFLYKAYDHQIENKIGGC